MADEVKILTSDVLHDQAEFEGMGYDKGRSLIGVGHHMPSYRHGYELGRGDAKHAHHPGMVERDRALYAAYLLLGEAAQGVSPQMERRWSQAVTRWRDEYEKALEAVLER